MRVRWSFARAVSFLLFAVALVVLAPLQGSAGVATAAKVKSAASGVERQVPSQAEDILDRTPGVGAPRGVAAKSGPSHPLPQSLPTDPLWALENGLSGVAPARDVLDDDTARSRHAPALLQVYRH